MVAGSQRSDGRLDVREGQEIVGLRLVDPGELLSLGHSEYALPVADLTWNQFQPDVLNPSALPHDDTYVAGASRSDY